MSSDMDDGTTTAALPQFDKLWNYANPAATEAQFRQILSQIENSAPTSYIAELLTQIARCQGLQGKFVEAHETLNRVEKMLTTDMQRAKVRYLLERGRVFNSSGNSAKALPLFELAWEIGKTAHETRLAFDGLHMIAIAQPDNASRIEWNLKGITAVQETPSERNWLPAFYNNLGEAYAALGTYEKALQAFESMSDFDKSRGNPPGPFTQKDIAKMLRKLGRIDEAFATIRPVFQDMESRNQSDGWIDEEMAECLSASGKATEAHPIFKRAFESLRNDPWILRHDPAKLERLKAMTDQ